MTVSVRKVAVRRDFLWQWELERETRDDSNTAAEELEKPENAPLLCMVLRFAAWTCTGPLTSKAGKVSTSHTTLGLLL